MLHINIMCPIRSQRSKLDITKVQIGHLVAIKSNAHFVSSLVPFIGSFMPKERKSYEAFFERMAPMCKINQI